MITAKNALEALCRAGLATSWTRKTEGRGNYRYSDYTVKSDTFSLSNETYGPRSFIYFRCKSPEIAHLIIKILRENGGNPGTSWNGGPEQGHIEMQVSRFKGYHWWE
jgi:hypothetical protein